MPEKHLATVSPHGLKLAYEVISPAEEAALIAQIEASGLTYYSYDAENPRSSTSYGWEYDFRNDTFLPCAPMPEAFRPIADMAAAFAGLAPGSFAECLLNRYEPGAIIQSHVDKPVWEHVIGISLGSAVTMQLRRETADGYEYAPVELLPRSMYLLSDDARHIWQHSLPPMAGTRWSITFRDFSDAGRRLSESCRS